MEDRVASSTGWPDVAAPELKEPEFAPGDLLRTLDYECTRAGWTGRMVWTDPGGERFRRYAISPAGRARLHAVMPFGRA